MIVDAHVHVVPPGLPGVGPLHPLLRSPPQDVAAALRAHLVSANVSHALAMGHIGGSDDDPLGVASTLKLAELIPGLGTIGAVDPRRTEPDVLRRAEEQLATGRIKALKAYLGYLHFGPEHSGYYPYYQLAERYRVPFVFHTGDTYSPYAKLKFAHPLLIDEVAVDFPNVKFVMAHLGNPWMSDAAEVIYKNFNVWADLSGLVTGDEWALQDEDRLDLLADIRANVRRALRYAERPNRFIFGSDWPLIPIPAYASFIASIVSPNEHELVFRENARLLFSLST